MDLQPQRKIGPTRRSVSGIHVFRKQTGIPFESTLERDFLIRTEFFLNVSEIFAQPIQIPFRTANGRNATYTPDFLVVYRLGNRAYPEYPKAEARRGQAGAAMAQALAPLEPEMAGRDANRQRPGVDVSHPRRVQDPRLGATEHPVPAALQAHAVSQRGQRVAP